MQSEKLLPICDKPGSVKKLDYHQKTQLAAEIREEIINTVSKTGGHLASNLGAVELTIALHSVCDLEEDRIIFDVGHQSYTHKLLTGRLNRFDSIRQKDGISGFTRISESKYDSVNSGHASDGISLALGFARARDLKQQNHKVVTVLGDGSLSGGMCFEALNDAGQNKTQLLIVLNDNEMSISKNVGALASHLTHLRQSGIYRGIKHNIKSFLSKGTRARHSLYSIASDIKTALKSVLIHDKMMFESMGIEYLGPIDGHNIQEMEHVFTAALKYSTPVIVHVVTKKGNGYKFAELNPNLYHGIGRFDVGTGTPKVTDETTCGKTAAEYISKKAETDNSIVCISAAMLSGTGLDCFKKHFPDRCYDVGIAEEHAAALAGGLALAGLKPCLALYSTFLQRAYDQVNINICLNKAPVLLLIDRSGLNGADGETHQGIYDIGILRQIPGLIIASPADRHELLQMIDLGLSSRQPFAVRYPKTLADNLSLPESSMYNWTELRKGDRSCIIATGRMVSKAIEASNALSEEGVNTGVVNARFIKPLDAQMLQHLCESYSYILTLEDEMVNGGMGEAIAHFSSKFDSIRIMGVPDMPIPAGSIEEQLDMCHLNTVHIVKEIKSMLEEADNVKSR